MPRAVERQVRRARRVQMGPDPEERDAAGGADGRVVDAVDEMVEESFPASDPPSGWAGEDPRDVTGAPG
jgi:hypothetical protein